VVDAKQRAEYKRRRTVAIRILRDAGMSEAEIQTELAKIRESLGIEGQEPESHDSVENLPAVIESSGRRGDARGRDRQYPRKAGRDDRNTSTNKEAVAQYDSVLAEHAERQCNATNAKGERCRKYAIPGGFTCRTHGGSTRHQINKARIRLEMTAVPLVRKLTEIAFDENKPAAVQLDAIKDALNRIGMTKPAQVEVGPIKPFEEVFDDIASGSRADYRAGLGGEGTGELDDLYATGQMLPRDYSGPEDVDYQGESATQSHPAPDGRGAHGDSAPLSGPSAHRERVRDGWAGAGHITGEDAIRTANQVNAEIGALRALPPGRSGR
jgi:hypothetical protein